MNAKLKDYVKREGEMVTTSVTVRRDQLAFVRKANLNMSKLIRDCLDELIKEDETWKSK